MGRKLKNTSTDSAPTVLVAVGAESSPTPWADGDGATPHVLDRSCLHVRRRGPKGWGAPVEHVCTGWRQVWPILDSLGARGRRVYVVAGRASDVLTQLHWWERVDSGEVQLKWPVVNKRTGEVTHKQHPLIMQGRPDIIGYTCKRNSFRWTSVTNWADVSIADAARQIGYALPAEADELDKWESVKWKAEDQARVISGYMTRLIDWWLSNECGVWKDTPGAAAWASYLRKTPTGAIVQHEDDDVRRLEGQACFGGRASCFYFGDIGDTDKWGELASAPSPGRRGFGLTGPVHRFDASAMYPTLLRDRLYPVRLLGSQAEPSVASVAKRLRWHLAVAHVSMRSAEPLLPRRTGQVVQYPVGDFSTVLTTPELLVALRNGSVRTVHRVAWYTPGRPFQLWAAWALGLRSGMKASGDVSGEAMVKLLANSLGGTLARRKIGWRNRPDGVPLELWGPWTESNRETGEVEWWRSLCGHVQQMHREELRPATLAACYAHLTAYGRVRMNDVRAVCGTRQVLWQDTDGVVVTDLGAKRLRASGHYGEGQYGKMRYEGSFSHARYLTAKHYWADGAWTLAGIHDGFYVSPDMTAHQTVTVNPARSAIDPRAAAVYRSVEHIDLKCIEPGVQVGADGWAVPPVIGEGDQPDRPELQQGELWPDARKGTS